MAGNVASSSKFGVALKRNAIDKPKPPFIPIMEAIDALSKTLPGETICSMREFHSELLEKRITCKQLVNHFRLLVGGEMLIATIKSYNNKQNNQEKCCCLVPGGDGGTEEIVREMGRDEEINKFALKI